MISKLHTFDIILTNLALMISWNMIIFYASITLNKDFFDSDKFLYSQKKWEKNGKFYTDVLRIKKWKDSLPQHIGKDGFSKKHLKKKANLSIDYLKNFITETCRAEWNHVMCCFFPVIALIINPLAYGILFSIISLSTNLPFIFIQRYNRIRLEKLLYRFKAKNIDFKYEQVKG